MQRGGRQPLKSLAEPLKVGLAQAGVGHSTSILFWDPLPLTLKSPFTNPTLFYTPAPSLGRPCWSAPARHGPGETGGDGVLIGTNTQCLGLAEGEQGLLDHSSHGFGAQPEKGGGCGEGWAGG